MQQFLALRVLLRPAHYTLSLSQDGGALDCFRSAKTLRRLLQGPLQSRRYSSHNFRIGAVSTTVAIGIALETVQRAGRWRSTSYVSSIHTQITHQGIALVSAKSRVPLRSRIFADSPSYLEAYFKKR